MVAYGTEKPKTYRPRLVDERLQNLGCRALGVVVPELMHLVSSRVRVHLLGARWACVRLGLYVDGRKASHI